MSPFIRANATKHERYFVAIALGLGLLAVAAGAALLLLGIPIISALGQFALVVAVVYFVPALVFARRRSRIAWGVLMVIFTALFVNGALSLTPQAILAGGAGLYVGYQAAKEVGYDLPVVGTVGTNPG